MKTNAHDKLLMGMFCRFTQLFSTNQLRVICWKTQH